jgi:hypothetical protein
MHLIKVKLSLYTPWRHLGERRCSSYTFLTLALDGCEWSASRPGCALPPRKELPVPIGQEAEWAPELVWTRRLEEESFAPAGDQTPVVQSIIRHYTDLVFSLVFNVIASLCMILLETAEHFVAT